MGVPLSLAQSVGHRVISRYQLICPGAFEVMLVIVVEAEAGYYHKGADHIAHLTGFSLAKVYRCLTALGRDGAIHSVGKVGKKTFYSVLNNDIV